MAGEFTVINRQLLEDLRDLGLWSPELKNKIIGNGGSISMIDEIPKEIKQLYKTVWEISQKIILNYAADRGIFIDQSQSTNIFIAQPDYAKLASMHFYGWKKGLKTGMYYLRTLPAANAIQYTVENVKLTTNEHVENNNEESKKDDKEHGSNQEKEENVNKTDDKDISKQEEIVKNDEKDICKKEDGCWFCQG